MAAELSDLAADVAATPASASATDGNFAVSLVTPTRHWLSAMAEALVAPSASGQVTILPQHRTMLCDLDPGVVTIRYQGTEQNFFVSGGFVEVETSRVVVLAQSAVRVEDIDTERARTDFTAAQARFDALSPADPAYELHRRQLAQARGRLQAVGMA